MEGVGEKSEKKFLNNLELLYSNSDVLNSKIKVRALSDLKFGLHEGVLRGRAKNLKRFFRHFRSPI